MKLKVLIDQIMIGTPAENAKADLEDNYGLAETDGVTSVMTDTIPIAKYKASNVPKPINTSKSHKKEEGELTEFLGKIIGRQEQPLAAVDPTDARD
ncbi:hypothetical protein G7046_g9751 [Stylonectria norvegica]|nr:hypothetical protein G7046_g9751 [Stylonectria norvegica]